MNEFDINKFVLETLKPLEIPVYFATRKEGDLPIVVYNITGERGSDFWENEEMVTKYNIAINIFSKGNYIPIKNKIKQLMQNAGFIRQDIPECVFQEDVEIFNQPMFFLFYKENY